MSKKNRVYYIDRLRVLACLAVVMIHVSSLYMANVSNDFNFFVANFFDGLSRSGVPIFVMISGALLLDEEHDTSISKMFGRIKKLLCKFIIWSIIYSIIYNVFFCMIRNEQIKIYNIIYDIIVGHYHLWFIYMLIGLYLIIPLLKLWIKKENKKEIRYFIILSFVFAFLLPQIIMLINKLYGTFIIGEAIEKAFNVKYVCGYTMYFILGWYINNFELKKKYIYMLGISGIVCTILGNYFLALVTCDNSIMFDNFNVNILFQSILIFYMVKNNPNKGRFSVRKHITKLSDRSLGIYFIHVIIVDILYMVSSRLGICNSLVGCIIIFVGTVSISSFIIGIIKKSPRCIIAKHVI